jgi:hypothetical protein
MVIRSDASTGSLTIAEAGADADRRLLAAAACRQPCRSVGCVELGARTTRFAWSPRAH